MRFTLDTAVFKFNQIDRKVEYDRKLRFNYKKKAEKILKILLSSLCAVYERESKYAALVQNEMKISQAFECFFY